MSGILGNQAEHLPESALLLKVTRRTNGWRLLLLALICLGASPLPGTAQVRREQSTDIVIVGAGPGGVAAAIQAARLTLFITYSMILMNAIGPLPTTRAMIRIITAKKTPAQTFHQSSRPSKRISP